MKPLLTLSLVGMIVSSVMSFADRAHAAQVGYELVVTAAPGGLFEGQSSTRGGVFYDEDLVPTTPGSFVELSFSGANGTTADPLVGLFFDAGPYTFTEADAVAEPIFTFMDGVLASISYIVTFGSSSNDLVAFGVEQFTFLLRPPLTFDNGVYAVQALVKPLAPVPLPAGLPLLAAGLGMLVMMRRRSRI